jgi:hypothetical protein
MIGWILAFTTLILMCLAITILIGAYGVHLYNQRQRAEEAKVRVNELRGQRLQYDLEVVQNRAQKLGNDVVLGDMRIERERIAMERAGLLPKPPGSDSATW